MDFGNPRFREVRRKHRGQRLLIQAADNFTAYSQKALGGEAVSLIALPGGLLLKKRNFFLF